MDRLNNFSPSLHFSIAEKVVYGKKDSVPIDQSSVQQFNIDPVTGRPLYDLTAIVRAQTKAEQQKVIESMVRLDSTFIDDEVTNEDALKYQFPRYAQMPSELAELSEKVAHAKYEEWKKQKAIEDEEQAKKEYEELKASIRAKRSDKVEDDHDDSKE